MENNKIHIFDNIIGTLFTDRLEKMKIKFNNDINLLESFKYEYLHLHRAVINFFIDNDNTEKITEIKKLSLKVSERSLTPIKGSTFKKEEPKTPVNNKKESMLNKTPVKKDHKFINIKNDKVNKGKRDTTPIKQIRKKSFISTKEKKEEKSEDITYNKDDNKNFETEDIKSDTDYHMEKNYIKEEKEELYTKLKNMNNHKQALFYILKSKFLSDKVILIISLYVKEFRNRIIIEELSPNLIKILSNKIKNFEDTLKPYNNENYEMILNKKFIPSKTAQNGLNFVTKEEENNLLTNELPDEIVNIFKLIYLYLDESFDHLDGQKLIHYLVNTIFKKYNCENFKTLFINHISKNINYSEKQLENIIEHVHRFPKILSSSDYLKINRSVSYMTFFLKEVYDYCSMKINGTYVIELRKIKHKLDNYKNLIDKYNN